MKKHLSTIGRIVPTIFILVILAFCGFRGCVVKLWTPPNQVTTYSISGKDDREMSFTFLPDRRALITYGDPNHKSFEAVLWQIRSAQYGRHYVGPLWNVSEGGESPFGIRWVSSGAQPVSLTYRVVNKFHIGYGDSSFPAIAAENDSTLYVGSSSLKFAGMWLKQVPSDSSVTDPILKQLETK